MGSGSVLISAMQVWPDLSGLRLGTHFLSTNCLGPGDLSGLMLGTHFSVAGVAGSEWAPAWYSFLGA